MCPGKSLRKWDRNLLEYVGKHRHPMFPCYLEKEIYTYIILLYSSGIFTLENVIFINITDTLAQALPQSNQQSNIHVAKPFHVLCILLMHISLQVSLDAHQEPLIFCSI